MDEHKKTYEDDYDSLKDVVDTQNNMHNPGHFIATGRVPTTVSAPGNAMPMAVVYFILSALLFMLSLFAFLSVLFFILLGISLFSFFMGLGYLRKAKKYYKVKAEMESEELDETVEDKLWQRKCPNCGIYHDIDYPKCPECRYDYSKRFR